ncbi:MICAL-like protein 1 isoform X2 [Belonocnema kinseyi]|nr:MICAL-like protein 1 isoform X2 [Belonocnema kinseyi]
MGSRLGMRRDPCAVCGLPVFLAEKLVVSRTLYHRTCFRCARCKNQLTPGNYYETEEDQYCCETCPDEECLTLPTMHQSYNEAIVQSSNRLQTSDDVYQKPLSDEEKSEQVGLPAPKDTGSPPTLARISSTSESTLHTQKMRLNFMASHLLSEKLNDLSVVDGAETLFQSSASSDSENSLEEEHLASPDSSPPCLSNRDEFGARRRNPINKLEEESRSFGNQRLTAISSHDVDNKSLVLKENTKDLLGEAATNPPSLVQQRLKMFEDQETDDVRSKAAILKKDLEPAKQTKRKDESLQSKDFEPKESLESEKALESRKNLGSKKPLESTDTSEILKEVANSCEMVEPLSLPDKCVSVVDVMHNMIEDGDPQTSNVSTESNLFTTKGINLSDIEEYPEALNPFADEDERIEKEQANSSTNPFDSEEDENPRETAFNPQPATRGTVVGKEKSEQAPIKRRLQAPHINLNPFLSDEDDNNDDADSDTELAGKTIPTGWPVPKPRAIKKTEVGLLPSKSDLERSGIYASNSSLGSCGSTTTPGGTYRKKKPAPQPPTKETLSPSNSNPATPTHASTSPRTTPRLKKAKPAPPPPLTTSTPQSQSLAMNLSFNESPIVELDDEGDICKVHIWEYQKSSKDEVNRNRQSLTCIDNPPYISHTDKSVQGKWKRKKGPAPPRPIPHRRKIKVLSLKDVKLELDEIEVQQQGLEKQGVRLEQIIRDKTESDVSSGVDVEELVLELFSLVNEKNELFRRQAELMLLRRQQRLEEEHADVEYQIRCLMCQPEATKTDFDKQREETLIQRLVQIVERRNEIVECLEMDRRREVEEDRSINKHMGLYAAKSKIDPASDNDADRPPKSKKGKFKEKLKEKKLKKSHKKDADKDIDEAEVKLKRHIKRKWF